MHGPRRTVTGVALLSAIAAGLGSTGSGRPPDGDRQEAQEALTRLVHTSRYLRRLFSSASPRVRLVVLADFQKVILWQDRNPKRQRDFKKTWTQGQCKDLFNCHEDLFKALKPAPEEVPEADRAQLKKLDDDRTKIRVRLGLQTADGFVREAIEALPKKGALGPGELRERLKNLLNQLQALGAARQAKNGGALWDEAKRRLPPDWATAPDPERLVHDLELLEKLAAWVSMPDPKLFDDALRSQAEHLARTCMEGTFTPRLTALERLNTEVERLRRSRLLRDKAALDRSMQSFFCVTDPTCSAVDVEFKEEGVVADAEVDRATLVQVEYVRRKGGKLVEQPPLHVKVGEHQEQFYILPDYALLRLRYEMHLQDDSRARAVVVFGREKPGAWLRPRLPRKTVKNRVFFRVKLPAAQSVGWASRTCWSQWEFLERCRAYNAAVPAAEKARVGTAFFALLSRSSWPRSQEGEANPGRGGHDLEEFYQNAKSMKSRLQQTPFLLRPTEPQDLLDKLRILVAGPQNIINSGTTAVNGEGLPSDSVAEDFVRHAELEPGVRSILCGRGGFTEPDLLVRKFRRARRRPDDPDAPSIAIYTFIPGRVHDER